MKDALLIVSITLGLALLIDPAPEQAVGLFDKEIAVDRQLHATLTELMEDGTYEKDDLGIDASGVQTIRVHNGRLTFDPPIQINWKFIETTVTEVSVDHEGTSIFIDVDHSPIDVKVIPR